MRFIYRWRLPKNLIDGGLVAITVHNIRKMWIAIPENCSTLNRVELAIPSIEHRVLLSLIIITGEKF